MRARIGNGTKRGEANIWNIGKPSDKASRAGRSRFQALCAWMRPRSGTGERRMRGPHTRLHGRIPGNRGPCSTFRRVADSGRNPLRAGAVLARGFKFGASRLRDGGKCHIARAAKTVTAQRVFHYVRGSKRRLACVSLPGGVYFIRVGRDGPGRRAANGGKSCMRFRLQQRHFMQRCWGSFWC